MQVNPPKLHSSERAQRETSQSVRKKSHSADAQMAIPSASSEARMAWLQLIRDRRFSGQQKRQLLEYFGEPAAIYAADTTVIKTTISGRLRSKTAQLEHAQLERDMRWLEQPNNALITHNDLRYPTHLAALPDAPIALFAQGDLDCLKPPKVAVVGSRRPTPIGAKLAHTLAREMADMGLMVVSGMALGIDGLAHQAALQARQPTIAVMACGLDHIYPQRHRELHAQIAQAGLLVSEYPLGLPPSKYTFPQRNRIVSGLSVGVVIVEAAARSGTLITARLAAEQNREVMVLPGSALSPQYRGSHQLLQQGAALVSSLDDILFCLAQPLGEFCLERQSEAPKADQLHQQTPQNSLLRHIDSESTSVDQLVQRSGLTAAQVSAMLLTLELDGMVAIADDGGYVSIV